MLFLKHAKQKTASTQRSWTLDSSPLHKQVAPYWKKSCSCLITAVPLWRLAENQTVAFHKTAVCQHKMLVSLFLFVFCSSPWHADICSLDVSLLLLGPEVHCNHHSACWEVIVFSFLRKKSKKEKWIMWYNKMSFDCSSDEQKRVVIIWMSQFQMSVKFMKLPGNFLLLQFACVFMLIYNLHGFTSLLFCNLFLALSFLRAILWNEKQLCVFYDKTGLWFYDITTALIKSHLSNYMTIYYPCLQFSFIFIIRYTHSHLSYLTGPMESLEMWWKDARYTNKEQDVRLIIIYGLEGSYLQKHLIHAGPPHLRKKKHFYLNKTKQNKHLLQHV